MTKHDTSFRIVINSFVSCRFDLIFLILDPQDELFDRKLAKHLVSLYYQSPEELEGEHMVSHAWYLKVAASVQDELEIHVSVD